MKLYLIFNNKLLINNINNKNKFQVKFYLKIKYNHET